MNRYRVAALALASCAALSVTACTAGVTAAPPASTVPASTAVARPTHTYSASATSYPPGARRMITIGGSGGSFPVPAGAKVIENVANGQQIVVLFNSVTPADVSRFYATELPQAGYAVSGNSVVDESGGTVTFIQFSGHGYKGNIASLSHFSGAGVTVAGLGTKNVTTITLLPK
jgi:hypothetical protein